WRLVPERAASSPSAARVDGGPAAVDGAALQPNDRRLSKLMELPAGHRDVANSVFWIDAMARPGDSTRAIDRLPGFVRQDLDGLGVALQEDWLELFHEHGLPAIVRIKGHAPNQELAAYVALEMARHSAVNAVFLQEETLSTALDRPVTLGSTDGR